MKYRHIKFCLCNIVIALAAGALFYLFFRKGTYLHSFLQMYLHYQPPYIRVRHPIFSVICNHFGDFVWAYALCHALFLIFSARDHAALLSFFVTSALGIGLELLQKLSVISGTFDCADIATEMIAAALAVIIIKRSFYK